MRTFVLATLPILIVAGTVARTEAATIAFVPSITEAAVGAKIDVEVRVGELGQFVSPSLGAFDVDVLFDQQVLAFVGAHYGDPSLGDQLDVLNLGSISSTTATSGAINVFEVSLDLPTDLEALQSGEFTLVTLMFEIEKEGTGTIAFGDVLLSDANGTGLAAQVGGDVVVTGVANSVPEPSMAVLFGATAAVWWRRQTASHRST